MPLEDVLPHLTRLWPGRHCDRRVVFADGHVYDRKERRRSLRGLIRLCKADRRDAAAKASRPTVEAAAASGDT